MNIYQIKQATLSTAPHFFARSTLKFFGQTMKSFSVCKQEDGRYLVTAPMTCDGKRVGTTKRFFNPNTNGLERN